MISRQREGRFERIPYLDLLLNLVKAEIKVRYQGSWLGIMWSLLNPAAQIVLYIFVFSIVFRADVDNYPLYLVSGLVNHIVFVQALSQGADAYVANGALLGKINFPRILVPLAAFVTNVYFWLMSIVVFAIAYPIIGGNVGWHLMVFVPVAGILTIIYAPRHRLRLEVAIKRSRLLKNGLVIAPFVG